MGQTLPHYGPRTLVAKNRRIREEPSARSDRQWETGCRDPENRDIVWVGYVNGSKHNSKT